MIDAIASGTHFLAHIAPVWALLPPELRGEFFLRERGITSSVREHAERLGVPNLAADPPLTNDNLTLVASSSDHKYARGLGRRIVYLNHGIGQAAKGDDGRWLKHDSYVGTDARVGCVLFLTPGPTVSALMRQNYPEAKVVEVGCPKLDPWVGHKTGNARPRVCLSTNWDAKVVPEFRSAFRHFEQAIPALAREFDLVGHAHPRNAARIKERFDYHGVPFIEHFDEVLRTCDLYMTDSSSTLYEFAATGRPVVVLNAPWYRRYINHGLRFWDAAHVGLNCDTPESLPSVVRQALVDHPSIRAAREDALRLVYGHLDGRSSERAAAALVEVLRGA